MRRTFLGGLALSALLLAACSGGDATGPSNTDFSGTYSLQSLTAAGLTIVPPLATGTLTLTTTTYTFDVTVSGIPNQQPIHMQDAGTYTFSGSSWTQNSNTTGQTVGTYSQQGSTLTFNMTQQGQATTTVWLKQ